MSKIKHSFPAIISAIILFLGITIPAIADPVIVDETPVNTAATPIPFQEIVHAGSSVDMTGIVYKAIVAARSYSATPATGVYVFTGTIANSPITINSGAASSDTDGIDTWDTTCTLADLFGSDAAADVATSSFATNFPQAGMYEFTITGSHEGGSSTDTSKWSYDEPQYLLQVAIKTRTEDVASREYAGWTLSKWNPEANGGSGAYEKINSGATEGDGKAVFEADYIAKSKLNITKQVSGDYASTTYQFPQTITIQLPEWYDETRDGAIIPSADVPLTVDGVTITREGSSSGNTLVFTTALAHSQTASFTVPVGTRYEVQETTNVSGKAIDGAGIEYTPNISWSVEGSQVSIMKMWNNLQIPDLSYEETVDMINNTVVSWHGQTRPLLSEWSDSYDPYEYISSTSYYNIYSGSQNFDFQFWNGKFENNGDTTNRDGFNLLVDTTTSGFTRGSVGIYAWTSDTTTFARIDSPSSWDVKDLKFICNGKTYAYDASDSSLDSQGFISGSSFIVIDNTITCQEDLLTFCAIVANGLAKNPNIKPAWAPVQYVTGTQSKDWGYIEASSNTKNSLLVKCKVESGESEDLNKISEDFLEITNAYWTNPDIEQLQVGDSLQLNIETSLAPASVTTWQEQGVTTKAQLYEHIFGTDAWQTWLNNHDLQSVSISEEPLGEQVLFAFQGK